MLRKLFSLIALLTLVVTGATAQITTSGLAGKITMDGSDEEVIGAHVQATHVPSGTKYVAVTNANGRFAIQGMRPGGPYEVQISYVGFDQKVFKNISLVLGETYSLNAKLDESSNSLEEIMVSAISSKLSQENMGAATNVSNEQIMNMPTVSRNLTELTRLSPYGGNGMTFAGQDGRTSNFTIDGGNFNENFGLTSNLPGGGNPISIEAIDELQVVISPFDVRQTNFIGGGVNAITKSGTNTFKGSAYIYHQNENMRGDAINGTQIASARDKDRTTTYGMTLGGPIIKNKLFFFVNAEYIKTPTTATSWRASEDGVGNAEQYLSYASVTDMQKVSDFVKEKYGYDTGSFTSFPADESNSKILARIDWNINDKHKLAFRYNYTHNTAWMTPNASSMDGGTRTPYSRISLYSMSYANSMYQQNKDVHAFSLDLNSRLTDNISNQLLITLNKSTDERATNSDEFPFIDILDGTGTNTPYISLGYELFSYNNAVRNTVWNAKDDVTFYLDNHKVMAGVYFESMGAENQYMRNGTGYYRYGSVDEFINGTNPEIVCYTYGYNGIAKPTSKIRYNKIGVYAQDDWNITDKLKLTYGLRIDGLFYNNSDITTNNAILALDFNGSHIDTGKWPSNNLIFSPRVGFQYDVFGDKTLKIRGGIGMFSGRLPLVFFTNMPQNSNMIQNNVQLNNKNTDMSQFAGGLVTDENNKASISALYNKITSMRDTDGNLLYPPTISSAEGQITKSASFTGVDPDFKMPQNWKASIAVDYQLPVSFPFTITAEGIYDKVINAATISDWNVMPVEGFTRWNGADNRPIYPDNSRIVNSNKAFVLENTHKGYTLIGSIKAEAKPTNWLSLMASYTKTKSMQITSLPGSNAESAFTYVPTVAGPNNIKLHNALNTTPDRLVASATAHDKSGNHYSIIYEAWRGGYNYSFMLANDMNGDGYSYDALYIPTDEEVANNEFRFATEDDKARFMDYVHANSYLSDHQGEYAEAYSYYNPWVHRIDIAYKHDFKVNVGNAVHKLQLSLDVKNVLNFFNDKWGVSKYMNPVLNEGRILKYEKTDTEGYPVFSTPSAVNGNVKTWLRNPVIGQCWYAGVGIKYLFN